MTRQLARGALIGALAALAVALFALWKPTFLGAEGLIYDAMSRRLAQSRPVDERIVIVAINEKSISALSEIYGRPPYSRGAYATVVDELRRSGASVIAFDLLLDQENPAAPDGDREFASTIAGTHTILAAQAVRRDRPIAQEFASSLWSVRAPAPEERFGVVAPVPSFRDAAGVGTIRLHEGDSATVRRYTLVEPVSAGHLGSLALECAREYLGTSRTATIQPWINGYRFRIAGREPVPVDRGGAMLIRWNAKREGAKPDDQIRYRVVDFHRVVLASLARNDPSAGISQSDLERFASQFRGKIVLIAYTAGGLFDLRPTALSSASAGVEIHANAIDNLLNNDFNAAVQPWFTIPLLLVTGLLFGATVMKIESQLGGAFLAIAGLLAVIAGAYGSLTAGYVLPAVAGISTVALTYLAVTVVKYVAEQQQSAQIRATFGRYVSPQILDHILAHPEKVQLGGERRELSILFSDIRGFTSISEAAEPEDVVEMLNEYLTKMVEILLAHGGTLDKFIGDAVMGFWGAPVPDPDHARHAVSCAVEMIEATATLRERWEKEGKAAIRIGIGINTGDAVAGNIGAEQVFSYTVIGDAVNLASRLESKNKDYGTEIIISEFTLARIGEGFDASYLDEVKVKGKEKAVRIYEVRGRRAAQPTSPESPGTQ